VLIPIIENKLLFLPTISCRYAIASSAYGHIGISEEDFNGNHHCH
jgi:hypothetical protein